MSDLAISGAIDWRDSWSPVDWETSRDHIGAVIRRVHPTTINHLTVSEWATRKRNIPKGLSPMWGPWDWGITPYLREIADCFSATSPVREVAVMKGARIGATVGILENIIGYTIDAEPGPMLYVSADAGVAEATVELRIDAMIQSAGIANKIFAQTEKKHGKGTGDTKSKKEFPGGYLMAVGPNSGGKLRGYGARIALLDEVDAYPFIVGGSDKNAKTADEGDPLALIKRRTDEYETSRKLLYLSTPLIKQTSRILGLFEQGDQRRYFVPCRHCGEMQYLRWRDESGGYRFKYDLDHAGRLVWSSVYYECPVCKARWKNEDKAWFLPRGEWRPTAEPINPFFRSYHIPSMLSPIGMRSWEDACAEWIAANG